MKAFNIYLAGVGGQGIGLLSEILLRGADHAGLKVKGVDTHGLAQRGGVVVSQLRLGSRVYSPLIFQNEADLVVALEHHEALRGTNAALKDGGTLIYYNTAWQPLEVRLNLAEPVGGALISKECQKRNIREISVFKADLKDARMQNIVLLANIDKYSLIPGVKKEHYIQAMDDLLQGRLLETNIELFEKERK
ncbi:MAG: 2-oxoacid:acceptor oxidoreductase family protein [Desulfobacteraceae bacterium]|nr:2-oxoacid:acceptor oxidoreductase family protein [Desulfobacteraceae bacterium]MDH3838833.1 2-oxoacid:acceptor oxidoreductase family protein [Desulfobacteraceae bacterium]MDH3875821.1 2-oxoacid:acceptor oxidoreductase family protein [Desulfobacteraceae bacterium]